LHFSPNERGETTTLTVERRGLFDVSVYKILDEDDLRKETVFGCEVAIPSTSYTIREETMYFPGKGKQGIKSNFYICKSEYDFFK
jgi:hypothetical protein